MDRTSSYNATGYSSRSNKLDKSAACDDERLDSGIDSYNPSTSFSMEDRGFYSISNEMSSLSLEVPTTTQSSINPKDIIDANKSEETVSDEHLDSGFGSIQEVAKLYNNDKLQWYTPDSDGDTCLQLSIVQKNVNLAFDIIQMCPHPSLLNYANEENQTALHLAVLTDQPQLTRCLVVYGANVLCQDNAGNTPLHIACERGFLSHIEMLTEKLDPAEDPGAEYHTCKLPQDVNKRNYLGFTPLHLAAMNSHDRIVKKLVFDLHCDVNIPDLRSGRTALHHAVERRHLPTTTILLQARSDVNALTYDECSPLHLAAARGLKNEATTLLNHGADLYLVTRDDYDVFELSAHNRRVYHFLKDSEKQLKARALPYQAPVMG